MTNATATKTDAFKMAQANEIWAQLTHGGRNRQMTWCWGLDLSTRVGGADENDNAFLMFKVNGAGFKGKVKIILTVNDDYTVEFWKMGRKAGVMQGTLVHTIEDLYGDNMTECIDRFVEGGKKD